MNNTYIMPAYVTIDDVLRLMRELSGRRACDRKRSQRAGLAVDIGPPQDRPF
jgi:hypothetical protein